MGRILIYTAITGGYDGLKQPFCPPDDFDFLCFVSKGTKKSEYDGVWRIEEIPYEWDDNILLSRAEKMNPHTTLPEGYDYSLWMDGNIEITDSSLYDICRDLASRDVKYAGVCHPYRDCVFDEMEYVLRDRRESLWNLLCIVTFLRRHHMPEHVGLMENNIIFRKHCDEAVVEFDRWWWECFLKFPRRDQMVHSFAMYDTPSLSYEYIFPKGVSARNFSGVRYHLHPAMPLTWWQRKMKYGLNKPETLILKCYISLSRRIWSE